MNFEIREYQLELYKKGRGKNSIIYLETGTGKTLILIMLMWHQLNIQKNKKVITLFIYLKQVVFLANTI
jgi:endoribonuclease Dicer